MSNRAERRAAVRTASKAANKAAKAQSAAQATSTATQPAAADQPLAAAASAMPANVPFSGDFTTESIHEEAPHVPLSARDTSVSDDQDLGDVPYQGALEESISRIRDRHAKAAASEAQINANRENAQKSTGPKTPEGKAAVSQNHRTHGLIGQFMVLATENMTDFLTLKHDVIHEYQPQTSTEWRLVQSLIQHYWRSQRALLMQEKALDDPKKLALYMRYQTTHERSYYRAQKELQKLVKERAKEQIGFERQNAEKEALEARTRLQHVKADSIEIENCCKKVMEVPIPGIENVPFKDVAEACSFAITKLVYARQAKNAAA